MFPQFDPHSAIVSKWVTPAWLVSLDAATRARKRGLCPTQRLFTLRPGASARHAEASCRGHPRSCSVSPGPVFAAKGLAYLLGGDYLEGQLAPFLPARPVVRSEHLAQMRLLREQGRSDPKIAAALGLTGRQVRYSLSGH